MVDLRPIDLGCDGQDDLAAKGKVSIQRRSEVASGRWHREGGKRMWARAGGKAEREGVGVWRAIRGSAEACSQAQRRCHVVDIACF